VHINTFIKLLHHHLFKRWWLYTPLILTVRFNPPFEKGGLRGIFYKSAYYSIKNTLKNWQLTVLMLFKVAHHDTACRSYSIDKALGKPYNELRARSTATSTSLKVSLWQYLLITCHPEPVEGLHEWLRVVVLKGAYLIAGLRNLSILQN
jgi:hypothetical protein